MGGVVLTLGLAAGAFADAPTDVGAISLAEAATGPLVRKSRDLVHCNAANAPAMGSTSAMTQRHEYCRRFRDEVTDVALTDSESSDGRIDSLIGDANLTEPSFLWFDWFKLPAMELNSAAQCAAVRNRSSRLRAVARANQASRPGGTAAFRDGFGKGSLQMDIKSAPSVSF